LSDGAARLAARYPLVWHVMEADGAGPWLRESGLLPADVLREGTENRGRFVSIALHNGGVAVLRPQQMPDAHLLPTLAGRFAGRPACWRRHVNRHVFFWAEARRRDAFTRACMRMRADAGAPPAGAPPVVLIFDTAALLERHKDKVFFATINTGSTVRGGARARRDENTLQPVSAYHGGTIAELAIRDRVDLCSLSGTAPPGLRPSWP
jgi:hypothetical protein